MQALYPSCFSLLMLHSTALYDSISVLNTECQASDSGSSCMSEGATDSKRAIRSSNPALRAHPLMHPTLPHPSKPALCPGRVNPEDHTPGSPLSSDLPLDHTPGSPLSSDLPWVETMEGSSGSSKGTGLGVVVLSSILPGPLIWDLWLHMALVLLDPSPLRFLHQSSASQRDWRTVLAPLVPAEWRTVTVSPQAWFRSPKGLPWFSSKHSLSSAFSPPLQAPGWGCLLSLWDL